MIQTSSNSDLNSDYVVEKTEVGMLDNNENRAVAYSQLNFASVQDLFAEIA